MIIGSAIVYIQAVGSDAETVNRFNVASGAATTIASLLLNIGGFSKKAPHYSIVSINLTRLRCCIEGKLVLPIEKRFSTYDIYSIGMTAYNAIILLVKEGLESNK
jgi:hypothetical protein